MPLSRRPTNCMRQIERASQERRTFSWGERFRDGRRHDRKGDCVMTPQEMRTNAHQCLSWSEAAHYRENREAFFALARAWMSAAIRLEQDNTPLETPLPVAPTTMHRRRAA